MLAPLQQAEAIDIRRKSDAFGEKVEDFRKFFQQKAPFSVPGGELKLEHVSFAQCQCCVPAQQSVKVICHIAVC